MISVPLVYAKSYSELKRLNESEIINVNRLKEILAKTSMQGMPRYYFNSIIQEMINFNLIKRLNNNGAYKILPHCCLKKIARIEECYA